MNRRAVFIGGVLKILIVSAFFPPLNSIASLRPYSWAKYWSAAGHDVTILTTVKDEDSGVSLDFPLTGFRVIEVPYPRFISRLKKNNRVPATSQVKVKKSALARLFDYLRFKKGVFNAARMPDFTDLWALKAYRTVKKEGKCWDMIISTAGPYSVHLIAHRLKKKGIGGRWVADYRDTWSNNYIYPGIFPFNVIEKWLEKRMLQSADLITTVSDPFADSFRALIPGATVETIANGFDPEDALKLDPTPIFPSDEMYRIVHTGSIYLGYRDPTPLFEAIKHMRDDPKSRILLDRLEVLFVGPRQANLENLIDSYDVGKWVKLSGFVSRGDALRMQRDAHALLFLAWNDPAVDGVLTGKVFEYLFAKTPILAIGAPKLEASQRLILEAGAGYALGSVEEIEMHLKEKLTLVEKETLPFHEHVLRRYDRKTLALKLLEVAG